jgi:hypothetical protein
MIRNRTRILVPALAISLFSPIAADFARALSPPETGTVVPPTSNVTISPLRGDITCVAGDPDCNPCANHVEESFARFADGDRQIINRDERSWSFRWDRKYPPSGSRPENIFDTQLRVITRTHIQGFVKTNHPVFRYAATHSHQEGHAGSVLLIANDKQGKPALSRIFRTSQDAHPSGLNSIGRFVITALGEQLGIFDLDKSVKLAGADSVDYAVAFRKMDLPVSLNGAGGGLAMTRLEDGTHLLVVTEPTDLGPMREASEYLDHASRTSFFRIFGGLQGTHSGDASKAAPKPELLGTWDYSQPVDWSRWYGRSENVSLINECGTGRIYAIHATGENRLFRQGFWILSEIRASSKGGFDRRLVRTTWQRQSPRECHLRSSGTAFVNPEHELELLCHEREARHQPFEKEDEFNFRVYGTTGLKIKSGK